MPCNGWGGCAYRPNDLQEMTSAYNRGGGYNEIVISAKRFEEALPATIEAFVYLACEEEESDECRKGKARAEHAHQLFEQEYGATPLLRLDTADWSEPFAPA